MENRRPEGLGARLVDGGIRSISQALRLSGASATEAQSALLQFGQALASGVLRGEEFNSVVENSPRLAKALADGLNVPIGRLRKLAEEGRLTADVVVNALMSQKDVLANEYAQLPQTVSQSFERLRNAFGQWISQVDASTGLTRRLAEAMTWLSQNLDTVMQWLKRVSELGLAVLAYRLIPAVITAWQAAGAAAVAAANATVAAWATVNQSLTGAVASIGLVKTAFGVLGALFAGWEIGTWLSEKFEIVRKAGIFMVEILMRGIEELRFRWEMFAALFTSDTLAQATQRHQARGNRNESYNVRMTIGPGYDTVVGVTGHAAGTKRAVAFPNWTVSFPVGFYAVTCSTQLGTDTIPANDLLQDSVEVTPPPGVGEASLAAGGARLQAKPNPARRQVSFQVAAAPGTTVDVLRIFDAAGRCVRTLRSTRPAVLASLAWDGRDERGQLLPGGVYFYRAAGLLDAVELVIAFDMVCNGDCPNGERACAKNIAIGDGCRTPSTSRGTRASWWNSTSTPTTARRATTRTGATTSRCGANPDSPAADGTPSRRRDTMSAPGSGQAEATMTVPMLDLQAQYRPIRDAVIGVFNQTATGLTNQQGSASS